MDGMKVPAFTFEVKRGPGHTRLWLIDLQHEPDVAARCVIIGHPGGGPKGAPPEATTLLRRQQCEVLLPAEHDVQVVEEVGVHRRACAILAHP
eukprot:CAMPEP_0183380726 /NCGR_PEP_ID=MMETSP0164_2-20130417/126080_1 /TAXON_ID=221442 /ORGANISM="Coccolithus pelagicus ssp braarudi, Strain PLY182g" /LENGTH=92 /DNA_ID=CAMNT_0025558327 /DNA_START=372 /DNA_END=650 /DNA_ORIENTATION=+